MEKKEQSFVDNFFDAILEVAKEEKCEVIPYSGSMDLIPNGCNNPITISKLIAPIVPNHHRKGIVICNGRSIFLDVKDIKNKKNIDQIDKLGLTNAEEIKNLFKKTAEEYEEYERKRKYAGISNATIEKIKYDSISSENFNKKNNDKKNNKKASIFRNFFPFGKGKGK